MLEVLSLQHGVEPAIGEFRHGGLGRVAGLASAVEEAVLSVVCQGQQAELGQTRVRVEYQQAFGAGIGGQGVRLILHRGQQMKPDFEAFQQTAAAGITQFPYADAAAVGEQLLQHGIADDHHLRFRETAHKTAADHAGDGDVGADGDPRQHQYFFRVGIRRQRRVRLQAHCLDALE